LKGNILLLGENGSLASSLEDGLKGASVRSACCVADTEGIGADIVVIACDHPFEELSQVRVHPHLFSLPVVLVAPGENLDESLWRRAGVWTVTTAGYDRVDTIVRSVGRLLSRLHHPSTARLVNEPAA